MTDILSELEEFDVLRKIKFPHLLFSKLTAENKRNIAFLISSKKVNEILLVSSLAFSESYIIAGITEKQIEYIALHGPREYKEILIEAVLNNDNVSEIMEIAALMDNEMGNSTINQQRAKSVIEYILLNKAIFMF